MISTHIATPRKRSFLNPVLPTRRRRWRVDADDVALPRREARPPVIAVAGVVQATGVFAFDFRSR